MTAKRALRPRQGILDIAPYVPGKSALAAGGPAIKLSSNETPFGPSPRAIEAYLKEAQTLSRYPDGTARPLREAIAKLYGLDLGSAFQLVGRVRADGIAGVVELADGLVVLHGPVRFAVPVPVQGEGAAVDCARPSSQLVERIVVAVAQVGHALDVRTVGKQIELIANAGAIGAWQDAHERRGLGRTQRLRAHA